MSARYSRPPASSARRAVPARQSPRATRRRNPEVGKTVLKLAIYLAALVPILLIYGTKERALITAPPIGLVGAAATWFFVRDTLVDRRRRILYAVVVGVVLAELTWALGYWAVLPVVGGAAIWLAFYVLSGIAEHALSNKLDRRIALEYGAVSLIGVLVVLASQPWRA